MKTKIILPLITAASAALFTGCATDAHYVQTGDREQIIGLNQINIQDYANAANAAVKDLLASGALDRVANPPALVEVSRVINNTGQQVDQDLITQKIGIALTQSGKAQIKLVDATAKTYQASARVPDFTLSGKIIETVDRAGSTTRTTYSFQMALNDPKQGVQVWMGEKEIGKQGTRNTVGF
jgi:penicillin-binding protein activator